MDTPSSTPVPGNVERLGVSDIPDHDVVCRYCFTGPDEDLGDLISPCSCKVSDFEQFEYGCFFVTWCGERRKHKGKRQKYTWLNMLPIPNHTFSFVIVRGTRNGCTSTALSGGREAC